MAAGSAPVRLRLLSAARIPMAKIFAPHSSRTRWPLAGIALASAAWMLADGSLAQPATPAPATSGSTVVSPLVVQAKPSKATLEAFAKTVDQFVKAQGKPGPIGQISRWREPVCPETEGLSLPYDKFVTRRVMEVAASIGAPDTWCRHGANTRIVFTSEPEALMADVRDHHPNLLGYHYPSEVRALAAFEPPMKSWYITGTRMTSTPVGAKTRGAVGVGAAADPAKLRQADAPGSALMVYECTGSHIRCEKASDINYVLVVVDARRIEGFTIGAVADEVAMFVLSRPAPHTGCSPLPSVMDALNPECTMGQPIEALTSYDEAYLKGLYGYQGSEIMAFENSAIAKSIVKTTRPVPKATQTPPGDGP